MVKRLLVNPPVICYNDSVRLKSRSFYRFMYCKKEEIMESKRGMWFRRGAAIVLAYCSLLSLNHIITLWGDGYASFGVGLFGYNIWAVGGYIFVVWILNRMLLRTAKRLHALSACVGAVMSLGIVYGSYAHFVNDIFQSARTALLQLGLILGIAAAAIPLSEEILLLFDRLQQWGERQEEVVPGRIGRFFAGRKRLYFFAAWIFIFVSYIPVFLGCWPGNFVYDAPFQLSEAIHNLYDTHHPLLHTLLMEGAYNFGLRLGDVSTGFQFYTLFQMLALSGSFAYCSYYLYRKKVPRAFSVGVLLWFAWFPMNATFAITATKDVLFGAFFLLMTVFLIRLLYDRETFHWYSYAGLIASGALSMLFRHNAVYAILAGGLILILLEKSGRKYKLRIALLLAGMFLASHIADAGLIAATDAQTTDRYRESLCVPLQSLARVACYRRDDLDDTLYEEICLYIPEEDIQGYNPYLADNVKSRVSEELLQENFINFIKLWIKVGIRFPDEYIESIVSNTMGYWYPLDQGVYTTGYFEFYHKQMWEEHEIEKRDYCSWASAFYGELFWKGKYRKLPILGYLFRPDGWIWFFSYYLAWTIYRKNRRAGLMGAIPFMYLGTCYLGPVPVLRYIYCLIVIAPLLLYMTIRKEKA